MQPDGGVYVKSLTNTVVADKESLSKILDDGKENRKVGCTNMNDKRSRSHCVFTVTVETCYTDPDSGEERFTLGKLNMVDLAGSERQNKTGASGAQLKEGIKINLSLSALGNVISALVKKVLLCFLNCDLLSK